jgi:hypothetical protein
MACSATALSWVNALTMSGANSMKTALIETRQIVLPARAALPKALMMRTRPMYDAVPMKF